MKTVDNIYSNLTWDNIEEWAGASIANRGQEYFRRKLVKDLALSPSGTIVAWVDGTER